MSFSPLHTPSNFGVDWNVIDPVGIGGECWSGRKHETFACRFDWQCVICSDDTSKVASKYCHRCWKYMRKTWPISKRLIHIYLISSSWFIPFILSMLFSWTHYFVLWVWKEVPKQHNFLLERLITNSRGHIMIYQIVKEEVAINKSYVSLSGSLHRWYIIDFL